MVFVVPDICSSKNNVCSTPGPISSPNKNGKKNHLQNQKIWTQPKKKPQPCIELSLKTRNKQTNFNTEWERGEPGELATW